MSKSQERKTEAMLDVALDLFWRKGYKRCSMADVVRKTGVARYGLYQAFKDKDQLYCATLKRYHQRLRNRFIKPFSNTKSNYNVLIKHFDFILDQLESGHIDGCYAHQAAIERASQDENVKEIVNTIFEDTKSTYRAMISNGIKDGDIRDLPVEDLIIYVMGIQRAVIAMTKQNCSFEERQSYVKCALTLLKP